MGMRVQLPPPVPQTLGEHKTPPTSYRKGFMPRPYKELHDAMDPERRERVEAKTQELLREIEEEEKGETHVVGPTV